MQFRCLIGGGDVEADVRRRSDGTIELVVIRWPACAPKLLPRRFYYVTSDVIRALWRRSAPTEAWLRRVELLLLHTKKGTRHNPITIDDLRG